MPETSRTVVHDKDFGHAGNAVTHLSVGHNVSILVIIHDTQVAVLKRLGNSQRDLCLGRDHFARAWSASLSGCGINGGSVYGKTDEDGQHVAEGEIGAAEMIATIYQALGIDPQKEYHVGARPVPLTDPGTEAVTEVLA